MLEQLFLGGYTRRTNDGLYTQTFDSIKGSFTPREQIDHIQGPTYFDLSVSEGLLFTIEKASPLSGVAIYQFHESGTWSKISQLLHLKHPGCHLFYRQESRTLYVSNYHEGNLTVYGMDANKQLQLLQTIPFTGSSIHPNQEQAHIHFASCLKYKNFIFICDLGSDVVWVYQLNTDGKIDKVIDRLELPAGTGPRHMVQHPHLPYIYIIGELDNTTHRCSVDKQGHLQWLSSYSNLAKPHPQASGAAIKLSNDGRHLYVSTRYADQLTVFEVDSLNGQLKTQQLISSYGKVPRDFCLSVNEQYILVAHQDSDYLSLFSRDPNSGCLTFIHNEIYAPECVCIQSTNFTPLSK